MKRRALCVGILALAAVAGLGPISTNGAESKRSNNMDAVTNKQSLNSQQSRKRGDGRVRDDAGPLQARFPVIDTPVRVQWSSGMLEDTVPGKSTYWIDAVVWLNPEVASKLRGNGLKPVSSPQLVDGVAGVVPAGEALSSSDLAERFNSDRWFAHVAFIGATDAVVISALGE